MCESGRGRYLVSHAASKYTSLISPSLVLLLHCPIRPNNDDDSPPTLRRPSIIVPPAHLQLFSNPVLCCLYLTSRVALTSSAINPPRLARTPVRDGPQPLPIPHTTTHHNYQAHCARPRSAVPRRFVSPPSPCPSSHTNSSWDQPRNSPWRSPLPRFSPLPTRLSDAALARASSRLILRHRFFLKSPGSVAPP